MALEKELRKALRRTLAFSPRGTVKQKVTFIAKKIPTGHFYKEKHNSLKISFFIKIRFYQFQHVKLLNPDNLVNDQGWSFFKLISNQALNDG